METIWGWWMRSCVCLSLQAWSRQLAWMKQLIYFIDPKHLPSSGIIRPSGLFSLHSAWTFSVSDWGPWADFLLITRHLEEGNTLIAMAIPCLEAGLPRVTATCQPPASASPDANRKKQVCSLTGAPDEAGQTLQQCGGWCCLTGIRQAFCPQQDTSSMCSHCVHNALTVCTALGASGFHRSSKWPVHWQVWLYSHTPYSTLNPTRASVYCAKIRSVLTV